MHKYQLLNSQVSFVITMCKRCREGGENRLSRVMATVSDAAPVWHRQREGGGCHPDFSRVVDAYLNTADLSPRRVDDFEAACLDYLAVVDRIAVRRARLQGAFGNLCDRYRYAAAQA